MARAHSDEEEEHLKHLGADVVIMGEREIGLGMVDVVNRDSKAVAEITAADAVESVLAPLAAAAAPPPRLPADPNLLAEAIEAAQAEVQPCRCRSSRAAGRGLGLWRRAGHGA